MVTIAKLFICVKVLGSDYIAVFIVALQLCMRTFFVEY